MPLTTRCEVFDKYERAPASLAKAGSYPGEGSMYEVDDEI